MVRRSQNDSARSNHSHERHSIVAYGVRRTAHCSITALRRFLQLGPGRAPPILQSPIISKSEAISVSLGRHGSSQPSIDLIVVFTFWDNFVPKEKNMTINEFKGAGHNEVLNRSTKSGLFVAADGGTLFWVLQSFHVNYAVQLQDTLSRPAYSFYELWNGPDISGTWLGPISLSVGPVVERAFQGRAGIIIRSGFRYYLKANNSYGHGQRLAISQFESDECQRWSSMFPTWQLLMDPPEFNTSVFQSAPEPRRMREYVPHDRKPGDRPVLGVN